MFDAAAWMKLVPLSKEMSKSTMPRNVCVMLRPGSEGGKGGSKSCCRILLKTMPLGNAIRDCGAPTKMALGGGTRFEVMNRASGLVAWAAARSATVNKHAVDTRRTDVVFIGTEELRSLRMK